MRSGICKLRSFKLEMYAGYFFKHPEYKFSHPHESFLNVKSQNIRKVNTEFRLLDIFQNS